MKSVASSQATDKYGALLVEGGTVLEFILSKLNFLNVFSAGLIWPSPPADSIFTKALGFAGACAA